MSDLLKTLKESVKLARKGKLKREMKKRRKPPPGWRCRICRRVVFRKTFPAGWTHQGINKFYCDRCQGE